MGPPSLSLRDAAPSSLLWICPTTSARNARLVLSLPTRIFLRHVFYLQGVPKQLDEGLTFFQANVSIRSITAMLSFFQRIFSCRLQFFKLDFASVAIFLRMSSHRAAILELLLSRKGPRRHRSPAWCHSIDCLHSSSSIHWVWPWCWTSRTGRKGTVDTHSSGKSSKSE